MGWRLLALLVLLLVAPRSRVRCTASYRTDIVSRAVLHVGSGASTFQVQVYARISIISTRTGYHSTLHNSLCI